MGLVAGIFNQSRLSPQRLRRHIFTFVFGVLPVLGIGWGDSPLYAHEIRPAIVTVDLSVPGAYTVVITANIEALLAGIGSEHKDSNDAPQALEYNN